MTAKILQETSKHERNRFNTELKLYINRRLYEKQIITEEMYCTVKELLLKQ